MQEVIGFNAYISISLILSFDIACVSILLDLIDLHLYSLSELFIF